MVAAPLYVPEFMYDVAPYLFWGGIIGIIITALWPSGEPIKKPNGGKNTSIIQKLGAFTFAKEIKQSVNISRSSFLKNLDTDLSDPEYYYYVGLNDEGDWKINRYLRTNRLEKQSAMQENNPIYDTWKEAWHNRASLNYSAD